MPMVGKWFIIWIFGCKNCHGSRVPEHVLAVGFLCSAVGIQEFVDFVVGGSEKEKHHGPCIV